MTNHEWLKTLSAEDFVNWLTVDKSYCYHLEADKYNFKLGSTEITFKKVFDDFPKTYSPTKAEVVCGYISDYCRLLEWLREERKME